MKINYTMQGLDCANCASKLERKVAKVAGVSEVSISFMTLRMTVDVEDSIADRVMQDVVQAVSKTMPKIVMKRR